MQSGSPQIQEGGAIDPYQNFSYSTVQAGSTIIGSAGNPKTIVVGTGDGDLKFPVGAFDVLVWPASVQPDPSNAEFISVTRAAASDTLNTTARGQQGSSALAGIAAGYQVAAGVWSKKMLDDIRAQSVALALVLGG